MQLFVLIYILLLIGIFFYIFELISYIIDVYCGDILVIYNLIDFVVFVVIFLYLIVGLVLCFKDLVDQFNYCIYIVDKFVEGCICFMQGFVKKVFIVDILVVFVDYCFVLQNLIIGDVWFGVLVYIVQFYFDFFGYSDMVIGFGLMMGFCFMENFNQFYISQLIIEFWWCWYISLLIWLCDYFYISLGGNCGSIFQIYCNLFLIMFFGGLWYGVNFIYIIWGVWYGMWLVIEWVFGVNVVLCVFNLLKWVFIFFLVVIGWVIFCVENLQVVWCMYEVMFSFGIWQFFELNCVNFIGLQVGILVLVYLVLVFFGLCQFYNQLLQIKVFKVVVNSDEVVVDGLVSVQLCVLCEVVGDLVVIVYLLSGVLVYQLSWFSQLFVLVICLVLFLLFVVLVLKFFVQSYLLFFYFQF